MLFFCWHFKDIDSESFIIVVSLSEGFPGRSKANRLEMIMTSFQEVIMWSHEGFRYFLIKYWSKDLTKGTFRQ